jgi:hypothetical protein
MRSDSEVHIISVMCSPTRYIPKRFLHELSQRLRSSGVLLKAQTV